MTAVLLSPHNDDELLFASGLLLRYRPHVIVVLKSQVQEDRGYGITAAQREAETDAALALFGVTWEQWPYPDSRPDWDQIELELGVLARLYDRCFAPAVEPDGHEHHNRVGQLARESFGGRLTEFLTYTPSGKSDWGVPIPYDEPLKRDALACYRSQIAHPSTAAHFLRDLTEYVAS
jgi:LmbE family N-acetylglucosaminyl deacetylase